MTISFGCPSCGQQFQTQDQYGGRDWRCPKCSAALTIPKADDIPVEMVMDRPSQRRRLSREDEDEWEDRRPREDYEFSPSWRTVRVGLRLLGTALTILLVASIAYLGLLAFLFLSVGGGGIGNPAPGQVLLDLVRVAALLVAAAAVVSVIVWIIGLALCCAAPAESRAKGLAISATVCTGVAVMAGLSAGIWLWVGQRPQPFGGRDPEGAFVLLGLAAIIGTVGYSLLIFSLRRVAVFFQRDALALNWIIFFVVHLVFFVGSILFEIFVAREGAPVQGVPPGQIPGRVVVSLVILLLAMVLLAWMLSLVSATRAAIPRPGRDRGWYDDA
jgi:hypothetical protein